MMKLRANSVYTTLKISSLLLIFGLLFSPIAQSQRPEKAFGIGFQAGNPTGLALQFFKDHGVSTDILIAYDLNNFVFLNVHALWNYHLDQSNLWHLFYGPGAFVGFRDRDFSDQRYDQFEAGVSGNFGVNYIIGHLELFGQLTPRLTLTPGTSLHMGGGIGLRFYI